MEQRLKQILIVLMLLSPGIMVAQEADKFNRNPAKRERDLAKKKIQQERDDEKALEELKKKHYKNQDRATRKRMKKTMKRSGNHNNNRGKFSFSKVFRKRR